MSGGKEREPGMTASGALKLEVCIIGLGILALVMIFQPFSLAVFAVGCGLVVLAGLANNLLPLAQPGVPPRTVVVVALIVAMIFSIVLLVAIAAAHVYGVLFIRAADAGARPFYAQPFVWGLAAVAAALSFTVYSMTGGRRR